MLGDELGELSVPLGEEDLSAGIIGVLFDRLLAKLFIQSFLLRIITSKASDVFASGISTNFHESVAGRRVGALRGR